MGRRGRDRMVVEFTDISAISGLSPLQLCDRIPLRARSTR